jgi:hypothetical protein
MPWHLDFFKQLRYIKNASRKPRGIFNISFGITTNLMGDNFINSFLVISN